MFQQWRDLLFLHWEFRIAVIQATLPAGLFVDTFHGKAYLGVVPFFMQNVRPRFLPSMPGISHFMEINLRTYVYDRSGTPGVWFYSLDANQRLAVEIARRWFHLPYQHARMQWNRTEVGSIFYKSTRTTDTTTSATSCFQYSPNGDLSEAASESLEFFLIERYRLFTATPDGLRCVTVSHQPYPLQRAEVAAADDHLLEFNGFPRTGRPPDHSIISAGVDVSIFGLERA